MSLRCWMHGHETYVERNGRGILELHCHACGYVTEAIHRTAKERQVMRRKFPTARTEASRTSAERLRRVK
jgi:uncharacterized Zn finger protein